jgi:HEAT repeat protein
MGLVRDIDRTEPPPDTPGPDMLIAALGDPDPDRRRASALGLGGVADAVPALLDRVGVEAEPTVRDAVLTTLAAYDNYPVAAGLVGHLASDDASCRTAVARALSEMPEAVPTLMPQLLIDPDHDIRIMTAMVLADLRHEKAPAWLTEMIRNDAHPNVVSAAIDAFLPYDVPLLEQVRARFPTDPFLAFTIEAALTRLVRSAP